MAISKIQSVLSLLPGEELVDTFKPVKYGELKGILILTNKRVIFVEEKGLISKSYKPVFSSELMNLTDIQLLPQTAQSIGLGVYVLASRDVEGLLKFHNERIYAQVQISKGLVEYKGHWMKPEEKFEQEQKDKGFVKYKGKWMTPEERFEQEQKDKGLLNFMGRWGTPEQVDKWKKLYAGLTSDFMDRSPHEFEDFIGELFRRMGYSTERTPLTSDYGADVIAKKGEETIAVQVKRNKPGNDVGVKDVNQVLGSMYKYKANKAIVITTSDFTLAARKMASTAPVDLWNRKKLYEKIERYFFGEFEDKSITEEISSKKREILGWFRKALALTDLKKYEEAIEAYEWVLELTKGLKGLEGVTAEVWNNKGLCLHRLGNLEDAMKCFDKALELNPSLQVAQNNKAIIQKQMQKPQVEPYEAEKRSETPVVETTINENLNLTSKGQYSHATILHVVENNEFQCPKSCLWYDKQNDQYLCPKRNLMTQNLMKDRLVCTTVLVRVKNVSSQLLVLENRHFLAFDSFGNQYIGRGLCSQLHPTEYTCLNGWYHLYNDAQVTCLLCFHQLPSDSKIIRMVHQNWVAEKGYHRHVETQDIQIAR